MTRTRGVTLIEMIFAMAIGLLALAVGYRAYFGALIADECEARRESMAIAAQNLTGRIKADVRSASAVGVDGGGLVVIGKDWRVTYRNAPDGSGVERAVQGARRIYPGARAVFTPTSGGVNVTLTYEDAVHGRRMRVETKNFVAPRNG